MRKYKKRVDKKSEQQRWKLNDEINVKALI